MGRQTLLIIFNCLILFILIISSATDPAQAKEYFVQSDKAPVWAQPSFQSNRIMVATREQRIELLNEKGGWLRVRVADQRGWMLRMMLSTKPPIQISAEEQHAVDTLSERTRRRPSAYATTAAARGLHEKRKRFSQRLDMDYKALSKMESWRADTQSAMEFMTKGYEYEKHP